MDPCPKLKLRDRKLGSSRVSLGKHLLLFSHPARWEQRCASLRSAVKTSVCWTPQRAPLGPLSSATFLLGFRPSKCLAGHQFERPSRPEPDCGRAGIRDWEDRSQFPDWPGSTILGHDSLCWGADHPLPWQWVAPCSGLFLLLTSILSCHRTPFFSMTPQGADSGARDNSKATCNAHFSQGQLREGTGHLSRWGLSSVPPARFSHALRFSSPSLPCSCFIILLRLPPLSFPTFTLSLFPATIS